MKHSYSKTQLDKALVAERKAMRERHKQSAFMRKTLNIYNGMEKRAGGIRQLDFTVSDLRALCAEAIEEGVCRYCCRPLRLSNLAVDHKQPLSRGGTHLFLNLQPCCQSCNWQKGALTSDEFMQLIATVERMDGAATADIKRRLTIGGKWSFGK